MMNNTGRSRLLLNSFPLARVKMSSKTKTPSHYETLEINSRATQGEIKSAYFKLSKQYHPDKNSSAEATDKFRDVAEAYEVLGNFTSRKSYDRSLLTNTHYQGRKEAAKSNDPKMKYYQSQAAIFRTGQKSGSMPLYDFDAWTKAHYGKTLNRQLQDRKESAGKRATRSENQSTSVGAVQDTTLLGVALLFIASLLLIGMEGKNEYDVWDPSLHQTELKKGEPSSSPEEETPRVS